MKLQQILFEGISPIVFHYTDYSSLASILKQNKFTLVPDLGSVSEKELRKKQKFYYISTTRHKLGGYNLEPYKTGVMINLDGRKLSTRYSGDPVDYWGESFREIRPEKAEAEDRIYSETPYIKNAKQYIKEVHILYIQEENPPKSLTSFLRKSIIQLKKANIPYWIYDTVNNFLTQNKNKAIDDIGETTTNPPYMGRQSVYDQRDFSKWFELYNKDNKEDLSKPARDLVNNMRWYRADSLASFDNLIHNAKKKDSKLVHKYIRILRREKLTSNAEFLQMMYDKWTKLDEN